MITIDKLITYAIAPASLSGFDVYYWPADLIQSAKSAISFIIYETSVFCTMFTETLKSRSNFVGNIRAKANSVKKLDF